MEINFQFSELKQIQNEKRRLLVETETEKLKSLDESFKKKFEHWRDKLGPRKQVSPVTICFSKYLFYQTPKRQPLKIDKIGDIFVLGA